MGVQVIVLAHDQMVMVVVLVVEVLLEEHPLDVLDLVIILLLVPHKEIQVEVDPLLQTKVDTVEVV